MVPDGPMTGQAFLAFVEQGLIATLKPGDIAAMDNLPAHKITAHKITARKIAAGRAARGQRRAVLPCAAPGLRRGRLCSPDINPIEMAFSKRKALLRQAPQRTRDGLWQPIGVSPKPVTYICPGERGTRQWLTRMSSPSRWQWIDGALAVDHRFARDIVAEIIDAGFEISR